MTTTRTTLVIDAQARCWDCPMQSEGCCQLVRDNGTRRMCLSHRDGRPVDSDTERPDWCPLDAGGVEIVREAP